MPSDLDPIIDSDEQNPDSGATAKSSVGSPLPDRLFKALVPALLAAIAVLLLVNLAAIKTLTTESKRSACYERLSFIGRPDEAQVPGAARLCEGSSPVLEYSQPIREDEGLRSDDGRLILGPKVKGNDENRLAVSLAVGLQRSDGVLFGEFARLRRSKMCPGGRTADFGRTWVEGEQRYSITMFAADTDGARCNERLVVAEVDWRDAQVVAPSENSRYGRPVPWLDEFRAGDMP